MSKPTPKCTLIIYRKDKQSNINHNWELIEHEPPDTVYTVMKRRGIDKRNYIAVCELDKRPINASEFLMPLLGLMNKIQGYEYDRRTDEEEMQNIQKSLERLKQLILELSEFIRKKFRMTAHAIEPDQLPDEADIGTPTPTVDMSEPPDLPEDTRPSM